MSKRKSSPKTLPTGKYIKGDSSPIEGIPPASQAWKEAMYVVPEDESVQSYNIHPEALAYNPKSSYVEGIHPINVNSLVDAQSRGEVTQRISTNIQRIREAIFNLEDKIKKEKKEKKKGDLRIEKEAYEQRLKIEIENVKNEQAMLDMDLYDDSKYRKLLRQKKEILKRIILIQIDINNFKASKKIFTTFKDSYNKKIKWLNKLLLEDTKKLKEIEDNITKLFKELYQYASQNRRRQLVEVDASGGKKTRKRRSTKKRRKTKTSHKKYRTGQKNIKMND